MEKIFKLPLVLYYDNDDMKKHVTGKKGSKRDNIAMFLKTNLISFPDRCAQDWIGEDVMINEKFSLSVSQELINKYKEGGPKENRVVYSALYELNNSCKNEETIIIQAHKSKTYEIINDKIRWTYHYVKFSDVIVRKLSRVFVSTIVFNSKKIKWPTDNSGKKINPEGLMIEFDMDKHTAVITDISVYSPIDAIPFQVYINDVLDKIWDEIEQSDDEIKQNGDKTEEKAVDYYTDLKIDATKNWGVWQPVSKLDEALATGLVAPFGVYMLYNSEKKTFYVGKGNEVYKRMDAHRKNKSPNEPMPEFDYFRFSLVDKKYHKELFLIENAAIHDCAAILNMPKAKTGHLNKISLQIPVIEEMAKSDKKENHVTDDLSKIIMTNTDEAQTKWNK